MKIVIIDNYDSFTYNLSHLVKAAGAEVTVLRNDQFALSDLEAYRKIILSPGPGIPSEAGLLIDVIRTYAGRKPILGVCLGHQVPPGSPPTRSSTAFPPPSPSAATTRGWSAARHSPTA